MTNCPKVYKNLQCESFGDRKKITSQMLRQFCKNDAYLYDQIMKLWDLTDPESRKRFHPPDFMDTSKSFGIQCYALRESEKEFNDYLDYVYRFSKVTTYEYRINFNTNDDNPRDNCIDESYKIINDESIVDVSGNGLSKKLERVDDGASVTFRPSETTASFHKDAVTTQVENNTPKTTKIPPVKEVLGKAKKDAYCSGPYKNNHCNSYWYAGFNLHKNYNIKSKWNKNQDSYDIPSVCRAQTFTAENTGKITKVSLMMQGNKSAKSPCIVEIRTVNKKGYPTTKVLARAEKKFTHSTGSMTAFTFDTKAAVKKGKKYAIVVRAPLNNHNKTYRWGGWAHTCYSNIKKESYYKGEPYLSEDNGKTWIKFGKSRDLQSHDKWYLWGYAEKPLDHCFEVFVAPVKVVKATQAGGGINKRGVQKPSKKNYKTVVVEDAFDVNFKYFEKGDYYLNFNPILCNPINKVTISPGYTDGVYSKDNYTWQILEPSTHSWKNMTKIEGDDWEYTFNEQGKYHYLKLRLKFYINTNMVDDRDVTAQEKAAYENKGLVVQTVPYFKNARIIIDCEHPQTAYLRTNYYDPDRTEMLGANIWSEVSARANVINNASVEIDVIHKKQVQDIIKFYTLDNPDLLDYYLDFMKEYKNNYSYTIDNQEYIKNMVLSNTGYADEFIEYLSEQLTPVYLLSEDDDVMYFNSEGRPTVKLFNLPSYPIGDCEMSVEDAKIDLDSNDVVSNVSQYGFTYNVGRNIKNLIKEISVSYYIPKEGIVEYDENGFLVNDLDSFERFEEVFVFDDEVKFTKDSDYLNNGVVKQNTFTNSYYDYNISPDGKKIIFNKQSQMITNLFNIQNNRISFKDTIKKHNYDDDGNLVGVNENENVSVYDIDVHIKLQSHTFTEFYDYEIDYDTGEVEFFTEIPEGDMTFTYNPLWVRGLNVADFPLKMDLWTETYRIGEGYTESEESVGGIYKQFFDEFDDSHDGEFFLPTNISPKSNKPTNNSYLTFKTSVPPRDNIRKLILNIDGEDGGTELIEDNHFFVDYLTNTVILNYPNLQENDTLTIKYTPNLTDVGLALGYRLRRPTYDYAENILSDGSGYVRYNSPEYHANADDVYILGNYFTYRT